MEYMRDPTEFFLFSPGDSPHSAFVTRHSPVCTDTSPGLPPQLSRDQIEIPWSKLIVVGCYGVCGVFQPCCYAGEESLTFNLRPSDSWEFIGLHGTVVLYDFCDRELHKSPSILGTCHGSLIRKELEDDGEYAEIKVDVAEECGQYGKVK